MTSTRNAGILDGKVAIVTGAGQGVGRGIALAMAREGAVIVVVDRNSETAAETVALIADTVDILVNNAVDAIVGIPLQDLDERAVPDFLCQWAVRLVLVHAGMLSLSPGWWACHQPAVGNRESVDGGLRRLRFRQSRGWRPDTRGGSRMGPPRHHGQRSRSVRAEPECRGGSCSAARQARSRVSPVVDS